MTVLARAAMGLSSGLPLLVAAALLLPGAVSAQSAATKIRFQLDWRIDGQQAPFLLTRAKGYFAQEGLDVTLDAGAGSALAVQRVASGVYDMGYGDTSALIEFLANNPAGRVRAVFMVQDSTPAGISTLRKSGITRPADMVGRVFGAPPFDVGRKLFPVFAKAQGIDPNAIKWQNVEPALVLQLLARGQVDAVTGFPSLSQSQIEALGVKAEDITIFKYKDYGVQIYGNAILAHPGFAEAQPRAVAAFLRAYVRGLKETIANPDAAIRYVKERDALIDEAVELRRLKALIEFIATPAAHSAGLGSINKLRMDNQVEDVARAFALKSVPSPDLIFNSGFLPSRAERALP